MCEIGPDHVHVEGGNYFGDSFWRLTRAFHDAMEKPELDLWKVLKFDTDKPHMLDDFRAYVEMSTRYIYLCFLVHGCEKEKAIPECDRDHPFHFAHYIMKL